MTKKQDQKVQHGETQDTCSQEGQFLVWGVYWLMVEINNCVRWKEAMDDLKTKHAIYIW